ncbi:MAG: helix-turn-helix transcriptional regulator [Alphaproteobacteria bacterium]|nr:helix-turn-helix transcriptional regulator [Alphaproteobacteria bacterium]OJV44973.1 MAG: hypothetical protein BGO28_05395 [Alphaproteobacteria bacterium 43-37]
MSSQLGKFLQKRIEEKGLTVYSLEKKAKLKPNAVRNIIEEKSKNPSAQVINAIARTLECPLEEIISKLSVSSDKMERTTHPWDKDLYTAIVLATEDRASLAQIALTLEDALSLIKEAYLYAITKNPPAVDLEFINWLIHKKKETI